MPMDSTGCCGRCPDQRQFAHSRHYGRCLATRKLNYLEEDHSFLETSMRVSILDWTTKANAALGCFLKGRRLDIFLERNMYENEIYFENSTY